MSESKEKLLRFRCPSCSAVLKGKLSEAGKERSCPSCEQPFRIPRPKVSGRDSTSKHEQELIPVVCGLCSTRMYATVDQIGKSIECPDCFTQTLIKAPPKVAKKSQPRMDAGFGYDLEPAQKIDSTKALGEELLEQADRFVDKKLEEEPNVPDRPFLSGVYLYPFYGRIFPVILGMALAWTMLLGVVKFAWEQQGQATLFAPFAVAGSAIILLVVTFPTLVSFQKIFENTSHGDEDTDCRPEGGLFAFIDWVGDVFPLLIAFFVSCAPGMAVLKGMQLPNQYLPAMAYSAFLLFPIVLLSMLESASISGIYSKPVWTSLWKLPGTWFKFYFAGTMLFVLFLGALAAIGFLAGHELDAATVSKGIAALFAALVFLTVYFRLLGRLAFVMSQKILVDVLEPDGEDKFDRNSKSDAEMSLGV